MKICGFALFLAMCCAPVFCQDNKAPVEITAEPSHHLKVENEYVRAFYVEIAPGQSTLMHHHPYDYIAVSLGPADIDSVSADGKVKHVVLEDGQVTYAPAGVVHSVTNRASTTFHNATIELLQNQGHPVCVKACENDPRAKQWPALPATAKLVGYGDSFRIIAVTVTPQQTISITDPLPHLVVLLTDAQARVTPAGQPSQEASHKANDILFHGPHSDATMTNTGTQDIRLVEVQFKPAKP